MSFVAVQVNTGWPEYGTLKVLAVSFLRDEEDANTGVPLHKKRRSVQFN